MSAIVIAMRNGACSAPAPPDTDKKIANATNVAVIAHFDIDDSCSRPRLGRIRMVWRKNRAKCCDPVGAGAVRLLALEQLRSELARLRSSHRVAALPQGPPRYRIRHRMRRTP